ncbi:hypothetical protein ACJMK2_019748 [Sinanodonta woodiana]|uniref:Uncharacterized protein n=1 Tax=Sinanodonta woodiana TaxID=1069815 RepID=A0ABD3TWU3_SINWO
MKTIVGLALCMLVATVAAQLYDRGIGRVGGIGGLGGIDGLGGIGGLGSLGGISGLGGIGGVSGIGGIGGIGGSWGVGSGVGIGSTYCPSSYCFNGQCSGLDRYAYYLGRQCYCSCGSY